jgi:L-ascorbate metabolism protein UlaG (beta-lactamase superfamily)
VYGFRPEESWVHQEKGYHGPDYIYIEDHKKKEINGLKITTLKSTDTGQGFLVEVDGLTIYHPGDHAWFAAEDELPFKKEVDFIAENASSVDIAFLPVTGCPSRWKKEFVLAGFEYNLEKLHPVHVYPMHTFNREYTMKEFAEHAEKFQSKSRVLCSENPGDSFSYNRAVVASSE